MGSTTELCTKRSLHAKVCKIKLAGEEDRENDLQNPQQMDQN